MNLPFFLQACFELCFHCDALCTISDEYTDTLLKVSEIVFVNII